jgi:hypothetical protein
LLFSISFDSSFFILIRYQGGVSDNGEHSRPLVMLIITVLVLLLPVRFLPESALLLPNTRPTAISCYP